MASPEHPSASRTPGGGGGLLLPCCSFCFSGIGWAQQEGHPAPQEYLHQATFLNDMDVSGEQVSQ